MGRERQQEGVRGGSADRLGGGEASHLWRSHGTSDLARIRQVPEGQGRSGGIRPAADAWAGAGVEARVYTSAPGRDVNMYASMPVGGSASFESSASQRRGGMATRAAPSAHDLPQYAPHAQQGHVLPPYLPSPSPRQSTTVGGATERFLAFDEFVGASGSDRAGVGERRQEVQGARERERERRKSAEALLVEGLTLTRPKSLERQRVRATSRELVRARCVEMFRCRWIACPGCCLCVLGGAYVFYHTIKMRYANTHTHTRARAHTHTHTRV